MRTGNPVLSDKTFEQLTRPLQGGAMTIEGTAQKAAIMLAILVGTALFTWGNITPQTTGLITLGAIGGLIVAIVTVVKKEWSPVTAPIYAAVEGLVIGGISAIFERQFPGIVIQAVSLTFGTLGGLLMAYQSKLIKVTENFKLGIVAATLGIAAVYLVDFVLHFFGTSVPFIHESGLVGIGISLFIVVIAALNLVLDFDFIERGAEAGAPKYMEWYGAFGLMVTLIWLYFEILRLLAKLNSRRH